MPNLPSNDENTRFDGTFNFFLLAGVLLISAPWHSTGEPSQNFLIPDSYLQKFLEFVLYVSWLTFSDVCISNAEESLLDCERVSWLGVGVE